jgi:hypothetical protein
MSSNVTSIRYARGSAPEPPLDSSDRQNHRHPADIPNDSSQKARSPKPSKTLDLTSRSERFGYLEHGPSLGYALPSVGNATLSIS